MSWSAFANGSEQVFLTKQKIKVKAAVPTAIFMRRNILAL